MSQKIDTNFANGCRNAVWLSGYLRQGAAPGEMLLMQSNNPEQMLPIRIPKHMRMPSPNTVCEVKCRVRGYRDGTSGQSRVFLEAFMVKRAGITAVPRSRMLLNALRERNAAKDNPFASRAAIIEEVRRNLKLEEEAIQMLVKDAEKRVSHRDGFLNQVVISGFTGHKAYIPPADDGSGDLGAVHVNVLQTAVPSEAMIVRVRGADQRISKSLSPLAPLRIRGRISVIGTQKDDDGNVVSRELIIDASRDDIGAADLNDFTGRQLPEWWKQMAKELAAQRAAQNPVAAKPAPVVVQAQEDEAEGEEVW